MTVHVKLTKNVRKESQLLRIKEILKKGDKSENESSKYKNAEQNEQ